jgi:hypothetical protein
MLSKGNELIALLSTERLRQCSLAVFIDADAQGRPGDIHRWAVRPQVPASSTFAHSCTPSGRLASAERLYGHRPQAVVIEVSAQPFAFGDTIASCFRGSAGSGGAGPSLGGRGTHQLAGAERDPGKRVAAAHRDSTFATNKER